MQLGQLNKVISLYSATYSTLSSGQKQETFTVEYSTLFANVNYKEGAEAYEASQRVASNVIVFTCHNILSDYTTRRKVLYDGVYYAVHRIIPVEDDVYMEITCKTRDNANIED